MLLKNKLFLGVIVFIGTLMLSGCHWDRVARFPQFPPDPNSVIFVNDSQLPVIVVYGNYPDGESIFYEYIPQKSKLANSEVMFSSPTIFLKNLYKVYILDKDILKYTPEQERKMHRTTIGSPIGLVLSTSQQFETLLKSS